MRRSRLPAVERLEARDLPSAIPLAPSGSGAACEAPAQVSAHDPAALASRWDHIVKGTWYVPAANLLSYFYEPFTTKPLALADQTIFQIPEAHRGVFSGQSTLHLSSSPSGLVGADGSTSLMSGVVTPSGRIRIEFTPEGADSPAVTGLGSMQFINGSWRMTMQMATGTGTYLIHWAYMTKLGPKASPPAPLYQDTRGSLRNSEWRRLLGTKWALADSQLSANPTGAANGAITGVFRIDSFRNGYFEGIGPPSNPLSVVGSITPEGSLFLVITDASGQSVMRTGSVTRSPQGRLIMHFRSYSGTPEFGAATLLS